MGGRDRDLRSILCPGNSKILLSLQRKDEGEDKGDYYVATAGVQAREDVDQHKGRVGLRVLGGFLFSHGQLRILLREPAERHDGTFWAVHILRFKLWKDRSLLRMYQLWTRCVTFPESFHPAGLS